MMNGKITVFWRSTSTVKNTVAFSATATAGTYEIVHVLRFYYLSLNGSRTGLETNELPAGNKQGVEFT